MEIILAIITAAGVAVPAYLILRSTREKDEGTKKLAEESGHTAHMSVIVGGLESVIKALQEDRRIATDERGREREELREVRAAYDALRRAKGRIAEIENGSA